MPKVVCHLVEAKKPLSIDQFAWFHREEKLVEADHQVVPVGSIAISAAILDADVVYSHVPIRWRTFPFLVALRAANPNQRIVHVEQDDGRRSRKPMAKPLKMSAKALFDKVVTLNAQ